MKKLAEGFNTAAQDSNPGSLSRESEALPLSHCALQSTQSHVAAPVKLPIDPHGGSCTLF